ncbi:hypothetical protein AB205_0213060 [Aquarana catesbeiana]|uniref:Transmembrane protein 214 n=1 Tax=Aquarana catesbeiana TaxID=8400 RepID=A0A2G9RLT2_AQUCT|nr:hypothetical protein AB205_0213060 [Aquarana catesbeiana]PIO28222.1 hypothetical protein AB205_0213060 [Aquarana catesbeiana]
MKKQNKEQVPPNSSINSSEPQQNKKQQQNSGKSSKRNSGGSTVMVQGKFPTLEEAIRALDLGEFHREMEKSQSMFPENPHIWVMDLASYLNFKLQTVKNDPLPLQQSHDYPYCLVSKELKTAIRSVLSKAPSVLGLLVDNCIRLMLEALEKPTGDSVHGYRICIQAVLLDKPKAVTLDLKKYLDMLRAQQSKPAKCLTIMWVVGQTGYVDLTEGLKVWLGLMLPVLGIKSLSPYAISYLDRLLLMHSNLTKGFGMIGPKDFFPLLDFAFMPNNSLTASSSRTVAHTSSDSASVDALFRHADGVLPSRPKSPTRSLPVTLQQHQLEISTSCLFSQNSGNVYTTVHDELPVLTEHRSAGTAARPVPQAKGFGVRRYTREHVAHLLPILPVQGYTQLPFRYEKREVSVTKLTDISSWIVLAYRSLERTLLHSLYECLNVDPLSFSVWRQLYTKHLPQSSLLLQHLVVSWQTTSKPALLQKMKGQGFPWFRLCLIALIFLSGFLIHDVRTSGSIQGQFA